MLQTGTSSGGYDSRGYFAACNRIVHAARTMFCAYGIGSHAYALSTAFASVASLMSRIYFGRLYCIVMLRLYASRTRSIASTAPICVCGFAAIVCAFAATASLYSSLVRCATALSSCVGCFDDGRGACAARIGPFLTRLSYSGYCDGIACLGFVYCTRCLGRLPYPIFLSHSSKLHFCSVISGGSCPFDGGSMLRVSYRWFTTRMHVLAMSSSGRLSSVCTSISP